MPTLICPDVLIDGTGVAAQRNACVVIEDERIVFVGTRQELDSAFLIARVGRRSTARALPSFPV